MDCQVNFCVCMCVCQCDAQLPHCQSGKGEGGRDAARMDHAAGIARMAKRRDLDR